jgi:hypothetical protein
VNRRPQDVGSLLRDCLVEIGADPDAGGGGSGFFAAPDYVITCSHVIRSADDMLRAGKPVSVLWNEIRLRGEVVFASPPPDRSSGADGRLWPAPDIAVIRLTNAPSHPCVRLARYRQADDDGPDEPLAGSKMRAAVRYAALNGPRDAFPIEEIHYHGPYLGMLRLVGDRFQRGMSGGPVVDARTGKVCAMLKTKTSDSECFAIPLGDLRELLSGASPDVATAILRGHDIFHQQDQRWVETLEPLWDRPDRGLPDVSVNYRPQPLLRPAEEAEILALLAWLGARRGQRDAESYQLYGLYDRAADAMLQLPPGELRDLADLLFRLCNSPYPLQGSHPSVRFAELLAALPEVDPDIATALRAWCVAVAARMTAARRPLASQPPEPTAAVPVTVTERTSPPSLIIKLEPFNPSPRSTRRRMPRYLVTVMSYRSDANGGVVFRGDRPYTLDAAADAVRPFMYPAIRALGGASVLIELALPLDLFDEPVHLWRLIERPRQSPRPAGGPAAESAVVGQRHPVVIRELDRLGHEEYRDGVGPWWDWLSGQQGVPLTWIGCEDKVTWAEMSALLATPPAYRHDCLAMTWPASCEPGDSLMDAALYANIPVAVWRRVRCKEHSEGTAGSDGCAGERFRAAVAAMAARTALHDLPRAVMQERNGGGHPETEELVLLWDNPRRGPLLSRLGLAD